MISKLESTLFRRRKLNNPEPKRAEFKLWQCFQKSDFSMWLRNLLTYCRKPVNRLVSFFQCADERYAEKRKDPTLYLASSKPTF
jgi:hypothetical protein